MPKGDPRSLLKAKLIQAMAAGDPETAAGREAIAGAQLAAVEASATEASEVYATVTTNRCIRQHTRSKAHPCPDCKQRLSIVRTVVTVLYPPTEILD